MNSEYIKPKKPFNRGEVFRRLEDHEFQKAVRENFADLLEDRATDPERKGEANELLFSFGNDVRNNKKIPRTPATISIFRGVFYGGPMENYNVAQIEIDSLEQIFFEPK